MASILKIHLEAFGEEEGPEISNLVNELICDKTAMPILSLVAVKENKVIGHVLFTTAQLTRTEDSVSAQILAPLAVLPDEQSRGVGGLLIEEGLKQLHKSHVELVFVLGHPDYYPRYGFIPAGKLGYEAPYLIPPEHAEAWMVQELRSGIIGKVGGKVQCCEILNQPQYWRE